jgi:hypothetical protein
MMGLSAGPDLTVNGQCLMSDCTLASFCFRPMSRLASNTVLTGFIATCMWTPTQETASQLALCRLPKAVSCSTCGT